MLEKSSDIVVIGGQTIDITTIKLLQSKFLELFSSSISNELDLLGSRFLAFNSG